MYTLGYAFRPWTQGKAIADGPAILRLHPRDRARVRHRSPDPLSASRSRRRTGRPPRPLDAGGGAGGWQNRARFAAISCSCAAGYYNYAAGYKPEFPGEDGFQGASSIRSIWTGGHRLRGQARGRDRQRRDRGDPGAQHCERRRARHHAAALADLCGVAAGQRRDRQRAAQAPAGEAAYGITRWKNVLPQHALLQPGARRRPELVKQRIIGRREACARSRL